MAARAVNLLSYVFGRDKIDVHIYPSDSPDGVVAGPHPRRILVIGESTAGGVGIATHELGLAANCARDIAALTGSGVYWSVRSFPDSRIRSATRCLPSDRVLSETDVVFIVAGMADVLMLTSSSSWRRDVAGLLTTLEAKLPVTGRIVVAEMPTSFENLDFMPQVARRAASRQARVLNQIIVDEARMRDKVVVAEFPVELQTIWVAYADSYPKLYAGWAHELVTASFSPYSPESNRPESNRPESKSPEPM